MPDYTSVGLVGRQGYPKQLKKNSATLVGKSQKGGIRFPMENFNHKIFDGHNDTLAMLFRKKGGEGRSFFEEQDDGHIDWPRAQKGGFAGGLFAIMASTKFLEPDPDRHAVPLPDCSQPDHTQRAKAFVNKIIGFLRKIESLAEGRAQTVRSAEMLNDCLKKNGTAIVLHIEGAEPLEPDLSDLDDFYEAGMRSLGMVWSRSNAFGHGVPFAHGTSPDTGPGLTPAGIELVKACNHKGIQMDCSHLNEKGFWDVARLSDAPLIASHSNAFKLCTSTRNLTDRQLDAIGERKGLVGINFCVRFLREDGQSNLDTSISEIVRHAEYIGKRIGFDHVGLGSDFDGAKI